ncbi:MAG TPA: LysR family transcriptional regulator, partial [Alphaproteobacteria bacterium]|nr:LysR family transcriptional regulator [Alphaproteobacteria bacterium]
MPRTLNLDTGLLRCFVAVAETGSFTAAGARVLRSQSAVSLQIKRLEELLESRLIERSPRHLALTPSGETLLVRARDILRLNDEAVAAVDAPGIRGAVSVGVPEDFATVHMPDVFAQFARSFTKVDLRVTCDLTLNLLARFRRDEFDLILIKREPEQRRNRSSLGMRVWRERLVWISGPHTRIDRGETLNLVVSPEPCVYRKRAVEALKAKGWNARVVYECAALSGALA